MFFLHTLKRRIIEQVFLHTFKNRDIILYMFHTAPEGKNSVLLIEIVWDR